MGQQQREKQFAGTGRLVPGLHEQSGRRLHRWVQSAVVCHRSFAQDGHRFGWRGWGQQISPPRGFVAPVEIRMFGTAFFGRTA
jgi:hypothetical protein